MTKLAKRTSHTAFCLADDPAPPAARARPAITASCPSWCTRGPHHDAYVTLWDDGEVTINDEVYLLRKENAQVVVDQVEHLIEGGDIRWSASPSLLIDICAQIDSSDLAGRIATAVAAAATLLDDLAASD